LNQQSSVPGREGTETNREIQAIYGTGGTDVTPIVPVVTLPPGTTVPPRPARLLRVKPSPL
jgi:hypothetical protein